MDEKEKPKKLSPKQQRFVEEYCKDFNASRAAKEAGYSDTRSDQSGYQLLRNIEISTAVNDFLAKCSMTAEEAIKSISDIARTRLNDYMIVKQVQGRAMEEMYVTVLLTRTRNQIQAIRDFMDSEGFDKRGRKTFQKDITRLQKKCLDYMAEIENYGDDVTRLVPGRPVVVDRTELDMVAIAKDKERGRIKNVKYNDAGQVQSIEMYAADANLEKILKYHGKLVDKHEHSGPNGGPIPVEKTVTWNIVDHTGGSPAPAPDQDYNKQ